MIKSENYITIQGWMVSELGLSGNELLVYAIINGFSQDGASLFQGSSTYICEWLGISKPTVFGILKKLCEKRYIIKIEKEVNGVKLCDYTTLPVIKKFNHPNKETLLGGNKETLYHNNSKDNNKDNIKENIKEKDADATNSLIDRFVNRWNNGIAKNYDVPKIMILSGQRRSKLKSRIEQATKIYPELDEIDAIFKIIADAFGNSMFLRGEGPNNDFKFDVDFVLQEKTFIRMYEGKYNDKN